MIDDLRQLLGPRAVIEDPDLVAAHEVDETGRYRGRAAAVVRPSSTEEVAAIVRWCREHAVALVPQGGNTGLVGGGVPRGGELVLSTRRLSPEPVVDPVAGQVEAGAGVTLGAVQRAASAAGWRYPVDLSARDTATIGGTVATNAGGHHVLRHGMTRRHLIGVEAVLGTGEVVSHLGGLVKDNTGYDLPGLLCGSEGTLGVITAARLALVPAPEDVAVALVGVDDLAAAVDLTGAARLALDDLDAAEVVLADGAALARTDGRVPMVFDPDPPVTLLLEVAGGAGAPDRLAAFLSGQADLRGTALAADPAGREALWRLRDEQNPAIARLGPPRKFDVTIPGEVMDAVVADVRGAVTALAPAARLWVFGHVGDGNLHLNVTGADALGDELDDAVLGLVARAGGSISAEHGIGVAKRPWLHLNRSAGEISAFRAVKAALDPDGILNPGVLL